MADHQTQIAALSDGTSGGTTAQQERLAGPQRMTGYGRSGGQNVWQRIRLAGAGWSLRNWRVRWRLLALVVVPTIAAIALGAVRIQAAQQTAASFARTGQLATAGSDITLLLEAVEDERDLTAGLIAARQSPDPPIAAEAGALLGQVRQQYQVTDQRTTAVQRIAGQIGTGYPAAAVADLQAALNRVAALPALRGLANSEISALPMINDYSSVTGSLLATETEIAAGSSSPQLTQSVTALSSLAGAEEEASQQRGILYSTLLRGNFELGGLDALNAAQATQVSDLAAFSAEAASLPPIGATDAVNLVQQFNDIVTGPQVDAAQAAEQDAVIAGRNGVSPHGDGQTWYGNMGGDLSQMRSVEAAQIASIIAQSQALRHGAQSSEQLTGAVVLVLLLLVLLATIVMARSMSRPLRKLRADALEVAESRLPAVVRRLRESGTAGDEITGTEYGAVEPIGIDSTDEIGQVARAFDQVHREAVRLAADEAMLRANLNAIFINLSRRSQSLVERQLGIIDTLEQGEQDPSRLDSLFHLDHLATRMRRNNENLLVLAGHDAARIRNQPVPLVDVMRAAVSEIEQYDRVVLNVQPGILVTGRAVTDIIHLVAELVENATAFSPEESAVSVNGSTLTGHGGVLVEITDQGVGIPASELAHANWRLDNPPVVDVAVSRRMGLFVVGRLAARHEVRVRLQLAERGGLTAFIWLPGALLVSGATQSLGVLPRRVAVTSYESDDRGSYGLSSTAQRRLGVGATPGSARAAQGTDTPAAVAVADPFVSADTESSTQRLPIYDAVESDWFRRGGEPFSHGGTWTTAADQAQQAAQTITSPAVGDTTSAGLPRRMPRANLIPGAVATGETRAPRHRSADQVRDRMTGMQRAALEARMRAGRESWDE